MYLSDANLDKEAVRKDILTGRIKRGMYAIMPAAGKDLLDIVPLRDLRQPHLYADEVTIIGLAKGYRRAVLTVQKMICDLYAANKDLDIHAFFDF